MKKVLGVLVMSASLFAAVPAVSEGMSNGRAWNGFGGGDPKMALMLKFVCLVGLSDGLQQAQGELMVTLFPKPAPGQEEKVAEIIPSLRPTGMGFPNMIAALDEFYGDAQNLEVPIPMAARYEKAKLEGRDPKELSEHLRRLRILYKVSKDLDSLQGK